MGDMADYYREMEERMELEGYDNEPLSSDSYWTTRERRRVRVCDMDDPHLLNTIRVLRGKSPHGTKWNGDSVRRREWLNVMANEAYSRGLSIEEVDEKDPVHE